LRLLNSVATRALAFAPSGLPSSRNPVIENLNQTVVTIPQTDRLGPGNVTASVGAVAMLRRLVRMIRHHIPGVRIRVRLDGGFAHTAVLQFLDAQTKLVVAMALESLASSIRSRHLPGP
jgi:hypothetical protein